MAPNFYGLMTAAGIYSAGGVPAITATTATQPNGADEVMRRMTIQRASGAPLTVAQQRRLLKRFGLGRTPEDDVRKAAADAKRQRKCASRRGVEKPVDDA